MVNQAKERPIALITGVSRKIGIGAALATKLDFLCSEQGAWINAQVLYSNGGFQY